jgi:hypothetical protein
LGKPFGQRRQKINNHPASDIKSWIDREQLPKRVACQGGLEKWIRLVCTPLPTILCFGKSGGKGRWKKSGLIGWAIIGARIV